MSTFYVSTFCNFAHRLRDGKPIEHNCYVLDPVALRAERDGEHVCNIVKEPRVEMIRGVKAGSK